MVFFDAVNKCKQITPATGFKFKEISLDVALRNMVL